MRTRVSVTVPPPTRCHVSPAHRSPRRGWPGLWPLLVLALLAAVGCRAEHGTVGAPEHFSPVVVDSPVGPLRLQLWVWPKGKVFRHADSLMIHYRMFNAGPRDHAYRDAAEFYHFRVIGPDGTRRYPRVVSATDGVAGAQRILLYPGEAGEMHTINLACMPYHAYTFEPLYRPSDPGRCEAAFAFTEAGTYRIIGQRVPPTAWIPAETLATLGIRRARGEDTLASHADTLAIEYQPRSWWQLW
jgi:hypothetical protein